MNTKILEIFDKVEKLGLGKPINLARKKFISLFLVAMLQSRSVDYSEIAANMNTTSLDESNLRRIQDFMANYKLNYVQIAMLLILLLPQKGEIQLAIDRTNWERGDMDINILTISAYCRGVGVPLWFELLEDKKGGNSNTTERLHVLRQVLKIIRGRKVALYADREFIGRKWISYLLRKGITFFIRIKCNTLLDYEGKEKSALKWLGKRKKRWMDNVQVWGYFLSVGMKVLNSQAKLKKHKYMFVLTNAQAKGACNIYKNRWSIEVFFQSIKGRGFNIEQTHLDDPVRLRKLFALVSIAFTLCLNAGIWWNDHVKRIPVKNHGYKKNSFFRHGLNKIREAIRLRKNRLINSFLKVIDELIARMHNFFQTKQIFLM
ncbi:MAG: IS4 family transposase [Bacteroidota bacterium]